MCPRVLDRITNILGMPDWVSAAVARPTGIIFCDGCIRGSWYPRGLGGPLRAQYHRTIAKCARVRLCT